MIYIKTQNKCLSKYLSTSTSPPSMLPIIAVLKVTVKRLKTNQMTLLYKTQNTSQNKKLNIFK